MSNQLSDIVEFKSESDRAFVSGICNQQPRLVYAKWVGGAVVKAIFERGAF